jgi:hypothetical protein
MADDREPTTGPFARPFVEFRPLLRAVGVATDPRKLILAALGLLALVRGWALLDLLFGSPPPGYLPVGPDTNSGALAGPIGQSFADAARLMTEPFRAVVGPFWVLFSRGVGPARWFQSLLMALWSVTVWGIFGGAIARIAVVQVASDRRLGIGTAFRFALRKSGSFIGAPLTPMVAVTLFSVFLATFGLLKRIPWGVGPSIAAFLGFVPLLIGLVMALILLGLAAGWPLMHATVAAEGEDAADALSRSYSYVNQRFVRYVAHVAMAWGVGSLGLLVVFFFSRVVLGLAGWGVALGAPESIEPNALARTVESFWVVLVAWLAHGWIYSYFWSAMSIIYLVLRRDVDGADWHDVYLPEHNADTFAGEPPAVSPTEAPNTVESAVG